MQIRLAPAALAAAFAVSSSWIGCGGGAPSDPAPCVPADEVCNGVDDDCDGEIDEPGAAGCTVYHEDSDADGYGGASACLCAPAAPYTATTGGDCDDANPDVHPGAPEVCNGVDDDCNAQVDEGIAGCCTPSDVRGCGVDQGICKPGTSTCGADFAWGPCLDAASAPVTLPGTLAETCDGLDDDCDGQVDEGYDVGTACSVGTGACAAAGVTACTADGTGVACLASAGSPGVEVCNGIDDDCDGATDEPGASGCTVYFVDSDGDGHGGSGSACLCAPAAPYTATAGGDCDDSNPDVHPGAVEVCDGLDDDCDGRIDLDAAGLPLSKRCYGGPSGTDGVGLCHSGSQTCASGSWGACAGEVRPSTEMCNGADDDCDGVTDGGIPGAGATCTGPSFNNTGSCSALWTCAGTPGPGPYGLTCTQVVGPRPEECNGLDDDCDGSVDEDAAGQPLSRGCYDGPSGTAGVGVCVAGVQTCTYAAWGGCEGEVLPSAETCNGRDDDCNGAVDANVTDPWAGQACCQTGHLDDCANTGAGTRCRAGAWVCSGGGQACTGAVMKSQETCNGVDDDCDGAVDDVTGLGLPCTGSGTNTRGACTAVYACNGAPGPGPSGLTCTQVVGPAPEICNGIDDDCDGTVDENPTDVGGSCCAYASGSTQGAWACSGGVRVCAGSAPAGGSCTVGASCCPTGDLADCENTGTGTRCAPGTCSDGPICVGAVAKAAETCNGADDDCDGLVDDVPGIGTPCTGPGLNTTGACRAAYACVGGAPGPGPNGLTCTQVVGPAPETCNGLDDNCDGTVDNNPTDVGGSCCAYASCSTQGVWVCGAGTRVCSGSVR